MSTLIRTVNRIGLYQATGNLIHGFRKSPCSLSTFLFQTRPYAAEPNSKSPFEANILRIIRNEIQYQLDYAPLHQPETKFNLFTVEDRPGEQWITMRGKFGEAESIKIEATMFDGFETVRRPGDDSSGEEDLRLHISLLVDISKADGSRDLEFVCSAWPDSLEVQKVYVLDRNGMLSSPFMGPDFRKLNSEIQNAFRSYLATRGINDELSLFLHEYIMSKDRRELIQWLGQVESFVER